MIRLLAPFILSMIVVVVGIVWAVNKTAHQDSSSMLIEACTSNIRLRLELERRCSTAGGRGIVLSKTGAECIGQATMLPAGSW